MQNFEQGSAPGRAARPGDFVARVFLARRFWARPGPGDFQPGFLEPGDFQPGARPGPGIRAGRGFFPVRAKYPGPARKINLYFILVFSFFQTS